MEAWRQALRGDPLPWLLERDHPAVRHLALTQLAGEAPDAPVVRRARAAAMRADPIAAILAAQDPGGFWDKPGPGYATKYTGTVWSLTFLEQMGADPADPHVALACDYVLSHAATSAGGFGASGVATDRPPPPSAVIHCLNGNLLRALLGFGRLDDPRVAAAIDWEARAITGDGFEAPHRRYYASGTSGPGFACVANGGLPCGWGAIKALRALAAIPPRRRTHAAKRAIEQGVEFLLTNDLATGDFPTDTEISKNWTKLGFPSGYVADSLQGLEALADLGRVRDPRATPALEMVLAKQDAEGRWRNEYDYRRKLWVNVDTPGRPSKWVTLRAARVLKAALG